MIEKNFWKKVIIDDKKKIRDVIARLNSTKLQIIIVVNLKKKFIGTITDGDIRRGLFKGCSLNDNIKKIINTKSAYVSPELSYQDAKILMKADWIRHMPVVDKSKRVKGLHLLNDVSNKKVPYKFVIMAGGFGKRLRPFTNNIPKPMIKIANKPILEHIILNAKTYGFKNFVISVHYLHKKVTKHFENGKKLNIKIKYIHEKKPKGTAASLRILKSNKNIPILVTNGDVISSVDYAKIIDYHKKNNSDATVVIRNITQKNPYGVVKLKKTKITGFSEKENLVLNINTGIYVLNSKVLKFLNKDKEDMPDFLEKLLKKKKKILAYPIYENWIDIGTKINLKTFKNSFN
tara:strand:+ start:8946 stop:9986 length:1041 start_codon:yes stop_codon:yes gene_type:complete